MFHQTFELCASEVPTAGSEITKIDNEFKSVIILFSTILREKFYGFTPIRDSALNVDHAAKIQSFLQSFESYSE